MFDEIAAPIFLREVIYFALKPNHEVIHGGNTNHLILIKWFPGASMYGALALAANLGIDHVQKLLSVAGNTLNPFDEMVSFLCQDFANMVITWSSSATSATAPTRRVSFFSIASSE